MNKAKPKALKTTTESTEIKTTIEPPILQEVSKKVAKKSPTEKFNAIIEPAKANEPIEKTVKSTTKKQKAPK